MNVGEAIASGSSALFQAGIPENRNEASSLLCFSIDRPRSFLVAHPEYQLTAAEALKFEDAIRRRSTREPFQYIIGKQEFYGLDFLVDSGVLIPRPETEILVEAAVDVLANCVDPRFCEIGVGSGCVSVSLLVNVPKAEAVASDVSTAALAFARKNAEMHGVSGRLELVESDLFEFIRGRFDLLVSNPPYVPAEDIEALQPEVRDFEPHLALSGGRGGLDIITRIANESPQYLKPRGRLMMEIGTAQSERVTTLFDPAIWDSPKFLLDLQQIPRIANVRLR